MELKHKLEKIFNNDYPGTDRFIADVIEPIFGNEIEYINDDLAEREKYAEKAKNAGIKHINYIADIIEQNLNANNIILLDVVIDDSINIERSRVNIQRVVRSIMANHQHLLIIFHYEDVTDRQWRFSYVYKGSTSKDDTSPKRYTYVFGRDYRGRTAAERFVDLAKSDKYDTDFEKAFSVAALSDEFFDKYRDIYADFVQYITGKRYEKIKNKWEEVKKEDPNTEIFSQFKNDDKRVRDYIKKMLGRLTFLCFLQRKGWMNNDRNFLQNLYQTSPLQADFLDAVLEPLFFGVLNTQPEKRKEVFAKNGWNTDFADEWKEIPYLNGGLFEQTKEDKITVKFPKKLFQELFKFLGEYNFTIDENDPDDAEIGIDPEMLGRVFESLLEDNKDKGAFYTPKEIVQYMCRQSIIEHLKTHTAESLHSDIEDLINKGWVNHTLQNRDNARAIYKLLKEVTVCDPAIGSGAFPMGILNILFTARQHLYGFLDESEPFNPLEVKKSIIRDNIYGVDIEQGAVDIARLRFWLAILVEEQVASPLPNLDYRIVRGNSLIPTFNDEYIQLPENPDGRTKLAKLKKTLHQFQNKLFNLSGDDKLQCEIDIKCKILEIIKIQLGIDYQNAQSDSRIESNIFEAKNTPGKALKETQKAAAIEKSKGECLFTVNTLLSYLTTTASSLADKAQIDIKFFDWEIIFSNIFSKKANASGFDIVIGNPPYGATLSDADKSLYRKLFSETEFKIDTYSLFLLLSVKLLTDNGILYYIIPNTILDNYFEEGVRKKLLAKRIIELNDLSDSIFENAVVHSMIFAYRNANTTNNYLIKCDIGESLTDNAFYVNSSFFSKQQKTLFSIRAWATRELYDKLTLNSINLQEVLNIRQAIKSGDDKKYIVSAKISEEYKPILRGKDINRFSKCEPNLYIHYGSFLACPRTPEIFEQPKILIREAGARITATIDYDNNYIMSSLYNCILTSKNYSLEYLLGLINSSLFQHLMNKLTFEKTKGAFTKAKIYHYYELPVYKANKDEQSKITYIVKSIMDADTNRKDFQDKECVLNIAVFKLYQLTYDEVLIVDPQFPISREEYESFKL